MLELSIITREILMGTQATSTEDLQTLRSLGVEGLLSLQDSDDFRRSSINWSNLVIAGRQHGIDMRHVPIRDFDPGEFMNNMDKALNELDDLLSEYQRVYVHCTAGINRSSGVVIAYLALRRGIGVDAAHRLVRTRRPQVSPYRSLLEELRARQLNSPSR